MANYYRCLVRGGEFVRFEQRLAKRAVAPRIVGGSLGLGNRDAEFVREHPDRFGERDLLVQLEELEHVAAGVAPEAVKKALVGMDVERRRLLVVERAVSLVRRARALERHVLLDHGEDVRLQTQVVDELLRKQTH